MKRLVSKAAIVSLALVSPFALATSDRMAQIEQRMEVVRDRLDLSEEQLDQLAPVIEENMEKRRAVLSNYGIDPENRTNATSKLGLRKALAMKKELNAISTDTLQALDALLTDEQLQEFKRMQAELQSEMRERIRGSSSERSDFEAPPGFGRGVTRLM